MSITTGGYAGGTGEPGAYNGGVSSSPWTSNVKSLRFIGMCRRVGPNKGSCTCVLCCCGDEQGMIIMMSDF